MDSCGLKVSQTVETGANDFKTREDDVHASKYFLRASPALGDKACASAEDASEKILSVQYFEEKTGFYRYQSVGFHKYRKQVVLSHPFRVSEAHAHGAIFSRRGREREDFEHLVCYETKLGSYRCAGCHKVRKQVQF